MKIALSAKFAAICTALTFLLSLGVAQATTISVDFDSTELGQLSSEQYVDQGLIFSRSLSGPVTSPGTITDSEAAKLGKSLLVTDSMEGVFLLFDAPINVFEANFFEYEQPNGGNEKTAVLIFDFVSSDPDELTAYEGETVVILDETGEWLYVRNASGQEGYIPKSYVQIQSVYLQAWTVDDSTGDFLALTPGDLHVSLPGTWAALGYASDQPIYAVQFWGMPFMMDDLSASSTVPEPQTLMLLLVGLFAYLVGNKSRVAINIGFLHQKAV